VAIDLRSMSCDIKSSSERTIKPINKLADNQPNQSGSDIATHHRAE